jgi:anaerobic selenocysteine-containing dehydrogenase
MNQLVRPKIGASACPHDCPSTCALEVEIIDGRTIGRVRGAEENAYTAGVICAKVARYAERVHHPDRLKHPLRRVGPKGSGQFAPISWDDALDLVAEQFVRAEEKHGSEAVWPYYYAGTMGFVQRDGINRLRHAKKYSGFFSTICVNPAWTGFIAGTGKLAGADPREMAKSDLVTIWGTNAVNTQVNDDARDARPQGTRRQDRRRRHLHELDHAAGRPGGADPARHRRRAGLRGDALPVPRQQGRLGLSRALHRRAARA